jgi:hypothetical protein
MSGKRLASGLNIPRPGKKALYVSGDIDDTILERGIPDSSIAFLQKPFTALDRVKKIRQVLLP